MSTPTGTGRQSPALHVTGLHPADVERLLGLLDRLVDSYVD